MIETQREGFETTAALEVIMKALPRKVKTLLRIAKPASMEETVALIKEEEDSARKRVRRRLGVGGRRRQRPPPWERSPPKGRGPAPRSDRGLPGGQENRSDESGDRLVGSVQRKDIPPVYIPMPLYIPTAQDREAQVFEHHVGGTEVNFCEAKKRGCDQAMIRRRRRRRRLRFSGIWNREERTLQTQNRPENDPKRDKSEGRMRGRACAYR